MNVKLETTIAIQDPRALIMLGHILARVILVSLEMELIVKI